MLSVLMIVLNGILGVTLLLGGIRHHEQVYNLQGASAYLGVIIPFSVLGARHAALHDVGTRRRGDHRRLAVYMMLMSPGLYAVFLADPDDAPLRVLRGAGSPGGRRKRTRRSTTPRRTHGAPPAPSGSSCSTMMPIVLLSKKLAALVDHGVDVLRGTTGARRLLRRDARALTRSPSARPGPHSRTGCSGRSTSRSDGRSRRSGSPSRRCSPSGS